VSEQHGAVIVAGGPFQQRLDRRGDTSFERKGAIGHDSNGLREIESVRREQQRVLPDQEVGKSGFVEAVRRLAAQRLDPAAHHEDGNETGGDPRRQRGHGSLAR
jgi:hypothetical protein